VNASISELVPLVASLSLRRRIAAGLGANSYALWLVVAGLGLSVASQLAWVGPDASASARFLAVLPALGFFALVKW
jgi:hypothetical protein